jgi:hypothetical protein
VVQWRTEPPRNAPDAPPSPLGGLVHAPGLLSRNGVRYIRCRTWRSETKVDDLLRLRAAKLALEPAFVDAVAADMAGVLRDLFGLGHFASVVPVACGHSRIPGCLSVRVSVALADLVGSRHVKAFADRFVSGSSHPKEFRRLPPLELVEAPPAPALVVDDVATSGFHIQEAVSALRAAGIAAAGAVWVAGVRQS